MQRRTRARKLRALPASVLESGEQVVLKRGRAELTISGNGSARLVRRLLGHAARGATHRDLLAAFPAGDRPAVANLIAELEARRFLVRSPRGGVRRRETSEDIFYWHFDADAREVRRRLGKMPVTILGVNGISRQIAAGLLACGVRHMSVLDIPAFRDRRWFDARGRLRLGNWAGVPAPLAAADRGRALESAACILATSDGSATAGMSEWNDFCLRHRRHFLPAVLQDLIGYVGPLVIPGETACYECLRLRQDSNADNWELRRAIELSAFDVQPVAGSLPPMAMAVADVAAMVFVAFYGGALRTWYPGTMIEINLVGLRFDKRRVLRIPRCPACSSLRTRSSTDLAGTVLPFDRIAAQ